jgi:ABC-type antimicrobial peptide transport system permease subunit
MKLCLIGLAIGVAVALWLTKAMASMLVQVAPTDLPTYAVMVLVFVVIGVLACLIPAKRAAGLDPMAALRSE